MNTNSIFVNFVISRKNNHKPDYNGLVVFFDHIFDPLFFRVKHNKQAYSQCFFVLIHMKNVHRFLMLIAHPHDLIIRLMF